MAVEDVDQHGERAVEAVDHFLRRAGAGAGGKAAEIDEHHGDAADFAVGAGALRHQPLDHLRRDVLAEQIGDAVARGRRQMLASNWRRSCTPTAPASMPQTRMMMLRAA